MSLNFVGKIDRSMYALIAILMTEICNNIPYLIPDTSYLYLLPFVFLILSTGLSVLLFQVCFVLLFIVSLLSTVLMLSILIPAFINSFFLFCL